MKNPIDIHKVIDQSSAIRHEFSNTAFIVLFNSGGGFFTATMRSAIFLRNVFGSKTRYTVVDDFTFQLLRVCISIKSSKRANLIAKAEPLKCKVLKNNDQVFIIALPKAIDSKLIKEWEKQADVAQAKIANLAKQDLSGDINLTNLVRKYTQEVLEANKNIHQDMRQILVGRLYDGALLYYDLLCAPKAELSAESSCTFTNLHRAKDEIQKNMFMIYTANQQKYINDSLTIRMLDSLQDLRGEVNRVLEHTVPF